MFRIFNGEWRGLDGSDKAIWGQFDVEFRRQLHHFKGANLAVFLAITLHCNEEGWAWPGAQLLAQETGYNISTVRKAIRELCKLRIDGRRVLAKYQPRKIASDNEESEAGKFATNHYLIFPSDEEAAACETKGVRPGAHLPLVEKPLTANRLSEKPLTKEEPVLKEEPKPFSKKQEPSPSSPDYLDLCLKTKQAQDKLQHPLTVLAETTAHLLGLAKVPNYRYKERWEDPLADILDQAEGDIERAEEAIRASAAAAEADALTITSPRSLHGLALQELAARGNGQTPRQSMDALPNAAEDPAYLAWLSKQEGEANVSRP